MALKDTITKEFEHEIKKICHENNFMSFEFEVFDKETGEQVKWRYDNPYFMLGGIFPSLRNGE